MPWKLEVDKAIEKAKKAREQAGSSPFLLAYDVLGIQEYVTANGRPRALRGGSTLITDFDKAQAARPDCIFAGGGRGTLLVRSEQEARDVARELEATFQRETITGRLATAWVPFDPVQEKRSLTWLQKRLDLAKEASPPRPGKLPTSRTDYCEDCGEWKGEHKVSHGTESTLVCETCRRVLEAGQGGDPSVNELATSLKGPCRKGEPGSGYVALVSADGNNMGTLFGSLESLLELAVISEAVSGLFQSAHQTACKEIRRDYVDPVAGGDDLRILLPPEELEGYVTRLVAALEEGSQHLQQQLLAAPGFVKVGKRASDLAGKIRNIGVGMGVVIADSRYPIARLFSLAHDLEVSAKQLCRSTCDNPARFALDYRVLTQPSFELDEKSGRGDSTGEQRPWARPLDLRPKADGNALSHRLEAARGLQKIPRNQLGILAQRANLEDAEFFNLLCYQVARSKDGRSKDWRTWLGDRGGDWTNRDDIRRLCPDEALLELVRLTALEEAGKGSAQEEAEPAASREAP